MGDLRAAGRTPGLAPITRHSNLTMMLRSLLALAAAAVTLALTAWSPPSTPPPSRAIVHAEAVGACDHAERLVVTVEAAETHGLVAVLTFRRTWPGGWLYASPETPPQIQAEALYAARVACSSSAGAGRGRPGVGTVATYVAEGDSVATFRAATFSVSLALSDGVPASPPPDLP